VNSIQVRKEVRRLCRKLFLAQVLEMARAHEFTLLACASMCSG
jgi:hypothetical protein